MNNQDTTLTNVIKEFLKWNDYSNNEAYEYEGVLEAKEIAFIAGYKSATKASEQRIGELTRELDAVKSAFYVNALRFHPEKSHDEIHNFVEGCVADGKVKILELTASNNKLLDALGKILVGYSDKYLVENISTEALLLSPTQSLAQHDNEVIERCANVCDDIANDDEFGHMYADGAGKSADEIRKMKVTP